MKVYIYTLKHPITHEIRYVGKTKNLKIRYHNHLNKKHNEKTHKRNWIDLLKKEGLKPIMKIIDEVDNNEWKYWEKYWINQLTVWGFSLVNHTEGGDGLSFGNKTSFKKGEKPWNKGKGYTTSCQVCGVEFRCSKSANRKYCSKKCYGLSQDINKNCGKFRKGQIPWNKGVSVKNKQSKHVLQYTLENIFIKEFNGCNEASQEMGCIAESIRLCCVGKNKTCKNFKWYYKNEKSK